MIPLDVLQKWAMPGKNEMSKQTYGVLRDLLIKKLDIPQSNIYLQGSYCNHTNVKDNSDIDIVVEFGSNNDVKRIKKFVFDQIQNSNNFHFTMGAKTVKYKGYRNQYVPADIVPCVSVCGECDCVQIYDSSHKALIKNYPKIHIRNGETKSGNTDGNFKKAVRMMKNAKNYLESKNIEIKYPSFAIECMMYNIPDEMFNGNESEVFLNTLNWLNYNKHLLSSMRTQDEKNYLFMSLTGPSALQAMYFIDKVTNLCNNWGRC